MSSTCLFAQFSEIATEADKDGDDEENDDSNAEDINKEEGVGTTPCVQRIVKIEPFVQRSYLAFFLLM